MILDSKKSPKLSTRCSRESCVGRVGNDFTLKVLSTSLKTCFILDVYNIRLDVLDVLCIKFVIGLTKSLV